MKKTISLILLTYLFIGNIGAQTITPVTGQATASLQARQTNTLLVIRKGIDTTNQGLRRIDSDLRDGLGNTVISRSNDIYTSVYNTETQVNYISDSINSQNVLLFAQSQYTTMTFTITCANSGTAVTAGQTLGTTGIYSINIPTGNWQVISSVITHSLQSASSVIRMFIFSGSQNIASIAEGTTFNVTANQATELTSIYTTATTAYTSFGIGGSTGAFSSFSIVGNTAAYTLNTVFPSGNLKLAFVQGASYTPPANQQYFVRVRLKRVS